MCAPSPSSCLAVFVEIAGGNRVRCFSTIYLVVIINHTGRFARVFAHTCAYTTARPHDRTTARSHDRTNARPHDRTTTARRPRNIAAFRAFVRPLLLKTTNRNGKRKRETQTRFRVLLLWREQRPHTRSAVKNATKILLGSVNYFAIFLARISGIFVNNPPPKIVRSSLEVRCVSGLAAWERRHTECVRAGRLVVVGTGCARARKF